METPCLGSSVITNLCIETGDNGPEEGCFHAFLVRNANRSLCFGIFGNRKVRLAVFKIIKYML